MSGSNNSSSSLSLCGLLWYFPEFTGSRQVYLLAFALFGKPRHTQQHHQDTQETFLWLKIKMGYVVVVSVPVILFIVIIALAFYLIGRATGRREAFSAPQHVGPPVPPPLQAQEKSDQV
ncbi:unnamed protein product [Prunus brigantina]